MAEWQTIDTYPKPEGDNEGPKVLVWLLPYQIAFYGLGSNPTIAFMRGHSWYSIETHYDNGFEANCSASNPYRWKPLPEGPEEPEWAHQPTIPPSS